MKQRRFVIGSLAAAAALLLSLGAALAQAERVHMTVDGLA